MAKNYYVILGLDPDATSEQIKSAYRRKVKEFHPDHFGEDCAPFLTIQEAYDVLSDPDRRQAYDARLARNRPRRDRPPAGSPIRPQSPGRAPAEPLIPHQDPDDLKKSHFTRPFWSNRALFEEPFGQPWASPDRASGTGSFQDEPLEIELSLTPAQARRGGRIQIVLPIQSRCSACGGQGQVGAYLCRHCLGEGHRIEEYPLLLSFPPGIAPHQTVDLSLEPLGLSHLYLRIHFVIRTFW